MKQTTLASETLHRQSTSVLTSGKSESGIAGIQSDGLDGVREREVERLRNRV